MIFLKIIIGLVLITDILDFLADKKERINNGKLASLTGVIIGICLRVLGIYFVMV